MKRRRWCCWPQTEAEPLRSAVQFWLKNLLIAGAILAAFYSFLLARASWLFEQDTSSSVPKAAGLMPYNGAYLARLAAWAPAQKFFLFRRAVELNPFDFESLIQLGIFSEFQKHNDAQAERYYLRAEEVNKMFLPKWTLTNYYFRHGRTAEFFRWATASLAITPYSPEPIFLADVADEPGWGKNRARYAGSAAYPAALCLVSFQ